MEADEVYEGEAMPVVRDDGASTAITAITKTKSLLDIAALMTVARQDGFRRNIRRCAEEAKALATLDKTAAASCFYALPPRSGGDGKKISGPSIGLAETLAASWGNLVSSLDNIEEHEDHIIIRGWIIDTQNGVAVQDFVRRGIRNGPNHRSAPNKRFGEDMIKTTIAAARSVLYRNLVLRIVPRPLVRQIYEAARDVALGDGSTFEERQKRVVAHWEKLGVPKDRLLQHLGITAMSQIDYDNIEYLLGVEQAIKLGDAKIEEVFAAPGEAPAKTNKVDEVLKRKTEKAKAKEEAPAPVKEPVEEPLHDLNEPEREEDPTPEVEEQPAGREPGSDDDEGEDEEGPITEGTLQAVRDQQKAAGMKTTDFLRLLAKHKVSNSRLAEATEAQGQAVLQELAG